MRGAIPPSTSATPTEKSLCEKRVLWGAVPPPTLPTEVRKRENESGTVPTSKTNILKKIAERKLPGNVYKNEKFLSTSMITTVRGGQSTVQKSTKGATISKKILEMQKIWGKNSVRKYQDGPRLSARGSIREEPIGEQETSPILDQPTTPMMRD